MDHSQKNRGAGIRTIQTRLKHLQEDLEHHSDIYLNAHLYLKMPRSIINASSTLFEESKESKEDEELQITYYVWYAG